MFVRLATPCRLLGTMLGMVGTAPNVQDLGGHRQTCPKNVLDTAVPTNQVPINAETVSWVCFFPGCGRCLLHTGVVNERSDNSHCCWWLSLSNSVTQTVLMRAPWRKVTTQFYKRGNGDTGSSRDCNEGRGEGGGGRDSNPSLQQCRRVDKGKSMSSSPAVLTKVHRPGLFSWRWRLEMSHVGLS